MNAVIGTAGAAGLPALRGLFCRCSACRCSMWCFFVCWCPMWRFSSRRSVCFSACHFANLPHADFLLVAFPWLGFPRRFSARRFPCVDYPQNWLLMGRFVASGMSIFRMPVFPVPTLLCSGFGCRTCRLSVSSS